MLPMLLPHAGGGELGRSCVGLKDTPTFELVFYKMLVEGSEPREVKGVRVSWKGNKIGSGGFVITDLAH